MTEPVWDGRGDDPWLPDRLDALAGFAVGERTIYDDYFARLSSWLVEVNRGVNTGPAPDPTAVFAHEPAWAASMSEFVDGPIRDQVGTAYRAVLGDGYLFDQRPAVTSYLAEVRNRMVGVPDQVYGLVASQIAEGSNLGESIPELAARVDQTLSATGTPRWANRATVVARTEAIGAANFGRYDSFNAMAEEFPGEEFELMWLATLDGRTRASHAAADGQRVARGDPFNVGGAMLRFPGDPFGPADETIQCLPGDSLVEFTSIRAVTRRWFEGEMVTLSFASGHKLTVTANHPILRADGIWTSAGLLTEGDHCIRAAVGGHPPGQPYEDRGPTQIGQLYRTARQAQPPQWVPLAPPDLHGDGAHGQVEVVPIDGHLRFHGSPASDQEVQQLGFTLARQARLGLGRAEDGLLPGGIPGLEIHHRPLTTLSVGGSGQCSPLGRGRSGMSKRVGRTAIAPNNTQCVQPPVNGRPANSQVSGDRQDTFAATLVPRNQISLVNGNTLGQAARVPQAADTRASVAQVVIDRRDRDAERLREGGGAFPRFVATTQITGVERHAFAGHVYNLDTGRGWYIANGIAVRNCRCTTLMVRPGEAVESRNRQFLGEEVGDTPQGMGDFHTSTASTELSSTVADMQASGRAGPARTRLSGGLSADTELVRLADGRTAVHKRAMDWGDADLAEEVRRQADAEQLTARLGQQIGAPVPEVVRTEADAVWVQYLEGATPGGSGLLDTPEGMRLGLLDTLTAQADRNPGNLLERDGQLFGVDHGFAYSIRMRARGPGVDPKASPVTRHFVAGDGESFVDSPLSPADIDHLAKLLEELRPDYAKLGRQDWLDYSLSVLEQLRPHATGGGLYG